MRNSRPFIKLPSSIADIAVINNALLDWNTGRHALMTLLVGALAAGICAACSASVLHHIGGLQKFWDGI